MELWKNTSNGTDIHLHLIKILEDNYVYILTWTGHALAIDPGNAGPVEEFLDANDLMLTAILNTHHHQDHTMGNCELKKKSKCPVIGPDDDRIPCLEQIVREEELIIGPFGINVIATPGHTFSHVVYYLPQFKLLFSGDTLFGAGCGRLFEGSAQDLFHSLQKIAALPDETLILCGHEYTEHNLNFALSLEPDNEEVKKRLEEVTQKLKQGIPTVPFLLKEEKATNPFLRLNQSSILEAIDMEEATEVEVLERLREMRDHF